MLNVIKIQNELFGLVGIRQPAVDSIPVLDQAITDSESGLFLDDVPPFNLSAIKDSQTYVEPGHASFDLKFNEFITNTQKSAISSVMMQVFDKPDYIDRNLLFINESPRNSLESFKPELAFMGYEITPSDTKNIGFKITRVHCQFDFDEPTVNGIFFLFNSERSEYLITKEVEITSNDQWVDLNWTIDSTLGDYKGAYYLLLGVPTIDDVKVRFQPWKRDYENASLRCDFSELCIENVIFNDGVQIANFNSSLKLEISENVGFNPDITVFNDYTDLIINNKSLFANAIQKQAVISFMLMVATSMRSNRNERLGKELVSMVMVYINGTNPDGSFAQLGLNKSLAYDIEHIRKEVHRLVEGYFGNQIMVDTLS